MPTKFEDFYEEIEAEAAAAGADMHQLDVALQFASQVVGRRTELGWTQEELAERSGINQSEVSRIERGLANPTLQRIDKLASALDCRFTIPQLV